MKKLFVGILAVGILGFAFTSTNLYKKEVKVEKQEKVEGIHFFHGTWTEALAKAEKENKLIFLDAYASWCGPCKMMARNTFTKPEVGEFFNKHFVNVKMDMEKNADGPRLSRKFSLRAYPSLYFINGKEIVKHNALGYLKPAQLISEGKLAVQKK